MAEHAISEHGAAAAERTATAVAAMLNDVKFRHPIDRP
jgi:hypothetical protein